MGRIKVRGGGGARRAGRRSAGQSVWLLRTDPIPDTMMLWPGLLFSLRLVDGGEEKALRTILPDPLTTGDAGPLLDDLRSDRGIRLPARIVCEDNAAMRALGDWPRKHGVPCDRAPRDASWDSFADLKPEVIEALPAPSVLPGTEAEALVAAGTIVNLAASYPEVLPMTFELAGTGLLSGHRHARLVGECLGPWVLVLGGTAEDLDAAEELDQIRSLPAVREATATARGNRRAVNRAGVQTVAFRPLESLEPDFARTWIHRAGAVDEDFVPEVFDMRADGGVVELRDPPLLRSAGVALAAVGEALSLIEENTLPGCATCTVHTSGGTVTVRMAPSDDRRHPVRLLVTAHGQVALHQAGLLDPDVGPVPLLLVPASGPAELQAMAARPPCRAMFRSGAALELLLENGDTLWYGVAPEHAALFRPGRMAAIALGMPDSFERRGALHPHEIACCELVPVLEGPVRRNIGDEALGPHPASGRRVRRGGLLDPIHSTNPALALLSAHLEPFPRGELAYTVPRPIYADQLFPTHYLADALALAICQDGETPEMQALLARTLLAAGVASPQILHVPATTDDAQTTAVSYPWARLCVGHWTPEETFQPVEPGAQPVARVWRQHDATRPTGYGVALVGTDDRGPLALDGIALDSHRRRRLESVLDAAPWKDLADPDAETVRALLIADALAGPPRIDTADRNTDPGRTTKCAATLAQTVVARALMGLFLPALPGLSLHSLAAAADVPSIRRLYMLMLTRLSQGLVREPVLLWCPPAPHLAEQLGRAVGRLPNGERAPEVRAHLPTNSSVAAAALAHAQWIADQQQISRERRVALFLDTARWVGCLDGAPLLDRFATTAHLPSLKRVASALGLPLTAVRPGDLPRAVHALANLSGVGPKSLTELAELVEQSLLASARAAPGTNDPTNAKSLADGLATLEALFRDNA